MAITWTRSIVYIWIINGESGAHQIYNRILGKLYNFDLILRHLWRHLVTWFHHLNITEKAITFSKERSRQRQQTVKIWLLE